MRRTVVINVVGLTERLIGAATPKISGFVQRGRKAVIDPAFPAVTCTAQSTYLTGQTPAQHGIVGNGWYNRELAEVQFWKQSNHVVRGRKVWEDLRALEPGFTCAKLFWWYNMYSSADYSITPRPMYPADGRKVFDIYSWPYSIRREIKRDLGDFPFPTFWGPAAGMKTPQGAPDAASRWIAGAAKWIENKHQPTLSLVYLPHLDYNLQRYGPMGEPFPNPAGKLALGPDQAPRVGSHEVNSAILPDLQRIDAIVGDLIDFYRKRGVHVMLLSEYGITNVHTPVHLNRLFRRQGWITVKEELGLETLDCGASHAFAVADHQVAHVYLNDPAIEGAVRDVIESQPGVARVLNRAGQAEYGIDHPRAGDLVALAREDAWFTYYYWLDDAMAPDFARCVDIHRKPGYDPVELFLDPNLCCPKLKIAWRLLKKQLGFRMLMDVIPLDATLVKGSHGIRPASTADYPLVVGEQSIGLSAEMIQPMKVYEIIKQAVLGNH